MKPDIHRILGDTPQDTLPVAILLILAAGMLDAYTFVGFGGVFANAMTGNLVLMTVRLTSGDARLALPYLAPLCAYVLGVAVAHCLKEKPISDMLKYPARVSLALEIAFLLVIAVAPASLPDMPAVAGIAFVAALQATAFTKVGGFAFTSVTTSANLRHFAESFMASVVFRDPARAREWRFFLIICLCFFAGALIGATATREIGRVAVWLPIGCLSLALALCMPWNRTMHRAMGRN